jgi:hypothetical protein
MTKSNNPPSPIEFAQSVIDELATFMANHPVIQSEDEARQAKVYIDRAVAALAEIEIERVRMVAPLNEQVAKINADHKHYHNQDKSKPGLFDKVLALLKQRVQAFMMIEEARRKREAEEAKKAAEEAEKLAREAEAREKEALENAAVGEIGVDVVALTEEADAAFTGFQAASRFAVRAEKETKVKIGGGFGKSLSIRNKEVLIVKDWRQAIVSVGLTDGIRDAILTAARNYRSEYHELPAGIESTQERSL